MKSKKKMTKRQHRKESQSERYAWIKAEVSA